MDPHHLQPLAMPSGPMPPCSAAPAQVVLEHGEAGLRALLPTVSTVVVIDVLSFCTAVDVATGRGAVVVPAGWPPAGAAGTTRSSRQPLVAAAERSLSQPSLSPTSLTALTAGTALALPSPNGSALTLLAAAPGGVVLAGCLRNARATAEAAAAAGGRVLLLAAGERWPGGEPRPALEDWLAAGLVADRMRALGCLLSPEAALAADASAAADRAALVTACASGRELVARGFAADVALAVSEPPEQHASVLGTEGYQRA